MITFFIVLFSNACKTSEQTMQNESYFCQGNNPFWKAEINKDEIIFEITGQTKEKYPSVKPVESGDLKIYATFITENNEKTWLKIKIKDGPCQTSSAGKTFPFKVEIERNDITYYGCAE